MMRFAVGLVAGTMLVGCATGPDLSNDPRGGGFYGGLAGIVRGDYAARQEERERVRDQVTGENAVVATDNRAKEEERDERAADVARLRGEVAVLDRRVGALAADVAALKRRRGSVEAARLERGVRDLDRRAAALDDRARAGGADLAALQAEKAKLQREYGIKLKTYLALNEAAGGVTPTRPAAGLSDRAP